MKRYSFVRTAILISALGFVISAYGQQPNTTQIVYTGKLLGYARVPSLQAFGAQPGCPETSEVDDSNAATDFLIKRNSRAYTNAILLGTGDNFSPELEARIFDKVPPPSPTPKTPVYTVGNKELYFSDGTTWFPYTNVPDSVEKNINAGFGTIPTDNVGCFLRAARFSATVPGKHDFYYGAERVRSLARFLARTEKEYDYQAVQMLGANLVLQTSPITPKPIPATLKEKPWFELDWSKDYPVVNLSDGDTVYPWFSYVKVKIGTGTLDEFKKAFNQHPIYVCPTDGDPNAIPRDISNRCVALKLDDGDVRLVDDTFTYYFKMEELTTGHKLAGDEKIPDGKPDGNTKHFSTLLTGKNYGLCNDVEKKEDDGTTKTFTNCIRFSVHTPLFYFPHRVPQQSANNYTDPDPYVYIDGRAAIFGVVEPDLGSQVGILNFGWKNVVDGLTSKVSVEDPAEALREQLDYFERQHPDFKDLKVLLAQTSPQRAKVLATKFPEFQIVVSAADQQQATSELDLKTTWKTDKKTGSLVAIPAPYFDSKDRKGSVHFGTITAQKNLDYTGTGVESWTLYASSLPPTPIPVKPDPAQSFWDEVKKLRNCLPSNFPLPKDPLSKQDRQPYLKLLVLCTMREQLSADVALIQSRDLFDEIPLVNDPGDLATSKRMLKRPYVNTPNLPPPPPNAENFQQMVDRLIWKGDLLTLLYVPGDALKKALDASKKFADDEKDTLSLAVDHDRKLEMLGVRKDAVTKEYIINELPLDPNKIYAVATTDFIGAGDTGYPSLAAAALNAKTHPAAYPRKLVSISSLVCRKLFDSAALADLYCLGEIDSEKYLDKTIAQETEPFRQPSAFRRFVDGLPFKGPNKNIEQKTIAIALEQKVQRRPIWMLSLKNFSFTFNNLNNNFTDKEIKDNFSGNPTSSVQAKHSRDFRVGLDVKGWRSSHRRDFYIEPRIDYERQTTGDTPETEQVSQISNRLSNDAGFVLWRKPGRPVPNFGLNLSIHAETQLLRPFSNFSLDNKDPLKIYQPRSISVLPRFGIRWQNREHFAEFGFQGGKEFDAFRGYEFDTAGGTVQCVVNPLQSIGACITDNSKLADGIRKDTPVRVVLEDRPRAGAYWRTNFSVPFGPKVKYTLDEEADFFFVNFGKDTSLDTRFRDISKHSLSFSIFPSVSIGPTLRLLLYQNKVTTHFLFQREFGIETKISFDVFNRRETGVQFKNKSK